MRHGRITARAVGYWVSTGLLAFEFLLGGVMSVARVPAVVASMQHLGYPLYFGVILGTWKILGALAIVAPRTPRLKEWAYAGIAFDLTGAFVSLAASGDGVPSLLGPVVFVALAVASWALRPAGRTVAVVRIPRPRSTERAVLQTA
ncbi:MAG TPA: DoxX family protein [Polyangiaceae bacterium]